MPQDNIQKLPTGFPSPLVSNNKKRQKSYGLAYAKNIETQWFGGSSGDSAFYNKKRQFQEDRKYAQGNQSPALYKKYLNPTGDTSYLNLDYSPIAIIPKYVDIIVNSIVERFFRVTVDAIDPISKSEKDKERRKLLAKMLTKDALEQFSAIAGEDFTQKGYIPENEEELDFHMETNFKMAVEIAVEQALEYTFQLNKFDKETFRRAVYDIVTLGIGGVRVYTDPQKGVVQRYIDPENLVYSYTRDPYFGDSVFFAEVIYMTIGEIRRRAPELNEKALEKLAKSVNGNYGNKKIERWDTRYLGAFDTDLQLYRYAYDQFKVEVLDFEFMTVDAHTYEEQTSKTTGRGYFKKVKDGYKPQNKDKRANKRTYDKYAMPYGGYKIVGQDIIFDYGAKKNVPRNPEYPNNAELSFKVVAPNLYKNEHTSMLKRMKPFADDMMRSWLKKQQIQMKQRPPGLAIDVDALEEVDLGTGATLKPIELRDIYDQTGDYYYRGRSYGGDYLNQSPIRELAISYIGLINEQVVSYNHALQQLQDVTGINSIRDASSPNPEVGVGQTQIALQVSNTATKHLNDASYNIVERVAKDTILRIQDIFEYSDTLKERYKEAIGSEDVITIEMMDKIPLCNFGISIDVDPSEDEKVALNTDIQIALKLGQIGLDDKYMIEQMHNVKDQRRYLSMRIRKREEEKRRQEQENIQLQGQQIQQQTALASQAKQAELQTEYAIKLQYEQAMHQMKMEQLRLQVQSDIQQEIIRGTYDLEEEKIQAGAKIDTQSRAEDRKDERMREEKSIQSELIVEQKSENPTPKKFTDDKPDIEDLLG